MNMAFVFALSLLAAPAALLELTNKNAQARTVAVRAASVSVAIAQIREQEKLTIPVFVEALLAVRDRIDSTPRSFSWIGHFANDLGSSIVLTTAGEVAAGTITRGNGKIYTIRPAKGGGHVLEEIRNSRYPKEHPPLAPSKDAGISHDAKPACKQEPANVVDLLVVYTPAARVTAGGTPSIQTTIDEAATLTNV